MQILILGMHRSGTSMTTRLVNMMGAYFGPESSIGEITNDNPKGFWERPEVFKLNEALLASKECSWHNLQKWSFSDTQLPPNNMLENIQRITLGMDAFRPWVLKDPRMCLLLPTWRPFLEVPIAVIVHRNPFEIAISLQKRNNFPLEYGLALWEYYAVGMLNATQDIPRIFVRYGELHQNPVKTCEAIYTQLVTHGVRRLDVPSAKEIKAFIDPALYRSKSANHEFTPAQKKLVEILRGSRPQDEPVSVSEESSFIIRNHPI